MEGEGEAMSKTPQSVIDEFRRHAEWQDQQARRCCQGCDHWRQITSAPEYGECKVPLPWWHDTMSATASITHQGEGRECAARKAKADV